ncbi:MAG: phage major capsid protein [Actinobacteria bacterium]|nr:phage major capsid protein [Actinomycetota bacterium]
MQHLDEVLDRISSDLARLDNKSSGADEWRSGSRYVGPNAERSLVEHVAAGGSVGRTVKPYRPAGSRTKGGLAFGMKALAEGTATSGGYLVEPEFAAEIAHLVRARSAVMQMGVTTIPVRKELNVTSVSTGATAAYVAENARIPVSEETFAQAAILRPRNLAALVPISNRLLRDADETPAVEDVIRRDLAEVLALRQDIAFLQGTGTGEEPLGLRNVAGTTAAPSLGANGGAPDWDTLKTTVANIRATNAPFERPGWIFNARLLSTLERLKDSTGHYLADTGLLTFDPAGNGGTLLGYSFRTTSQIPVNLTTGTSTDTTFALFCSDWGEVWVGQNDAFEIVLSGEATYTPDGGTTYISAFQNQQTLFRASTTNDIAIRRPQFLSVLTGVRP